MKRKLMKTTTVMLMIIMAFSFTAPASAAVSSRDAYYLSVLAPKPMPKAKESYPAKLILNVMGMTPARLEFKGTCGINAEITDEEMLDILKASLPAVSSYRELQDPVDDKVLVREITEKLEFTDEDIREILDNWKSLLGLNFVSDIISGKTPGIGGSEVTTMLIEAAGGKVPVLPIIPDAPGVGTVVSGVFISFDQYEKDVEKYENIIKLSKAKERLRAYDSLVR